MFQMYPYPNINRISLIKRAVGVGARLSPISQLELAETASFPCFNSKHLEQRLQMVAPGQWCKIYHANITPKPTGPSLNGPLSSWYHYHFGQNDGPWMKPKQHVWDVAPQQTFLLFADANPGMKPCPKCSARQKGAVGRPPVSPNFRWVADFADRKAAKFIETGLRLLIKMDATNKIPKSGRFLCLVSWKKTMLNMDRSGVPKYPKIVCYRFAPCWSILHRDTTSRMILRTLESESRTRNT